MGTDIIVTTLEERPDLKDAVTQLSLDLTSPRPGGQRDWGWPIFLYKVGQPIIMAA
jgi:hypothetical protein